MVPVAHNAGEFWPRNAFFKRPGEVVVSIGPVIDTRGLSAEEINRKAETWVEGEMRRLFPHHYRDASKPREKAQGNARKSIILMTMQNLVYPVEIADGGLAFAPFNHVDSYNTMEQFK